MLKVFRIAVVIVLSLLFVCFAPQTFGQQAERPVSFSFRSLAGGNISEADLRGKVVVLIFSDTRLPISRERVAAIHRLAAEFAPRNTVFYLVNTNSERPRSQNYASDEAVRAYARRLGLRLPVLRDPDGKTLQEYGRGQIPLLVVLDRQGRVDGETLEGFGPAGSLERILWPRLERLTN